MKNKQYIFTLGQKIFIDHKLARKYQYEHASVEDMNAGHYGGTHRKYWGVEKIKPIQVIVIGERTLFDGYTEHLGDGINIFIQTGKVRALLVVSSMRRNPFYVYENIVLYDLQKINF